MSIGKLDFRGKWVLVSGASSGLGNTIATRLALKHGANIIAVARRKAQLEELKVQIESGSKSQVLPIAADLSEMSEVDRVLAEATQGRSLYAAILNAGVTHFGEHEELDWSRFEKMLNLNVTSIVRMTQPLLTHFRQNQLHGGLLIVSSMAGIVPVPYQAAYSGTKAFLVNFGCALNEEVRKDGLSVSVFAPGGIRTEMTAGESFKPLERWLMPVEKAADQAIEAFRNRKRLSIPGMSNQMGAYLAGVLPRSLTLPQVGAMYRKALEKTRS